MRVTTTTITTMMMRESPNGVERPETNALDGGGTGEPRTPRRLRVSSASETSLDPRLMIWLSPSFPVGSFAYSHGLELAVERGWIKDMASLQDWLRALVAQGSLRTDLILCAQAWRAASAADRDRLVAINDIAIALQPSAERHLETVTQGGAFLCAMQAAWPVALLDGMTGRDIAYPVAAGAAIGAHGLDLEGSLMAYAVAFTQNLASAGIRLSLIGQSDAQRILAALLPQLQQLATETASLTLDDLGSATFRSDIASLLHETQHTRLFRS